MTLTAETPTPDTKEAEDQTVWVSFRLTQAERAELKDHAHLARISVSELTRCRVLGLPPPKAAVPAVNSRVHADLGRVGNNLNQVTKLVHESGQLGSAQVQPLARVLAELKGLLDRARLELIGAYRADDQDPAA